MERLLKKGHSGIMAQLHSIQEIKTPSMHPNLQSILYQHHTIFQTSQGLPPSPDDHDHSITLISGILPPNVRSCHHPFSQKNEIEKIVQEFLEVGVIHPNTNPYSSPTVMVLKKEGTWHMCPYFLSLEKLTLKEKNPIPIIDDLLDKLSGAQYFTKLDLCYVYHQIHMKEEHIPKTSFHTHEGHFEFLVIPFGLCNAPSTFQSPMNHVFHSFLHHFVLVFFDDIIIYRCWPLTKFWEFLGHVDLFWNFDSLSKEERKTKRRSQDLDPLLGLF
jgi:hypothetical protein